MMTTTMMVISLESYDRLSQSDVSSYNETQMYGAATAMAPATRVGLKPDH